MRSLVILAAILIAALTPPTAGMAQMRGGFYRPAFARFHPRFERGPPRGSFMPGGPKARLGPPYPGPPPPGREDYAPGNPGGEWREQQDVVRQGVREGQMAPLEGVIDNLRHLAPGRQLNTVVETQGGRTVYRVVWVTKQGRRVDYIVDAASGRVLGER